MKKKDLNTKGIEALVKKHKLSQDIINMDYKARLYKSYDLVYTELLRTSVPFHNLDYIGISFPSHNVNENSKVSFCYNVDIIDYDFLVNNPHSVPSAKGLSWNCIIETLFFKVSISSRNRVNWSNEDEALLWSLGKLKMDQGYSSAPEPVLTCSIW